MQQVLNHTPASSWSFAPTPECMQTLPHTERGRGKYPLVGKRQLRCRTGKRGEIKHKGEKCKFANKHRKMEKDWKEAESKKDLF